MTKQKKSFKWILIFLLMIFVFLLGGLTNAYLTYMFDTAPKYAKVRTDFAIFAREKFISTGYWPEDVDSYKKNLLAKSAERLFAYAVNYELKISMLGKTDTYAKYMLTFSSNKSFEIMVEK